MKTNPNASYYIYINGVKYFARSGSYVFSLISEENEMNIKLELPGGKILASFTYMTALYYNLTNDYLKCEDDSYYLRSYFIKKPKISYSYFWYSLSNKNIEYYNNNQLKSGLNQIVPYVNWNNEEYFILMKDKGCFQLKYLNNVDKIIIYNNDTLLISTSDTYKFKFTDKTDNYLNITIYSKEKNFINKIKIENELKNLDIKNMNDTYYYNFISTNEYKTINFEINFNLNNKEYIFVNFRIEYYIPPKEPEKNENGSNYTGYYVFAAIMGSIIVITDIIIIIKIIMKKCKSYKEEKEVEELMLRNKEKKEKIENFYELIKKNCTKIEKVCLVCLNEDEDNEIHFYKNISNNGDIINDINFGKFKNFLNYIEPKKCPHFYHEKCLKNSEKIKNELTRAYNCPFCRLFMTSNNLKNFGCFFTKSFFKNFYLNFKKNLDKYLFNDTFEIGKISKNLNEDRKNFLTNLKKDFI